MSQAPIIVISANAFADDRERSVTAACNDYLAKPVCTPELLERIQKQLDLQWLRRTAPRPTPVLESSVCPSAEDLEALRELGAMSYIRGILEKLDAIDRLTPASTRFTAPLCALVKATVWTNSTANSRRPSMNALTNASEQHSSAAERGVILIVDDTPDNLALLSDAQD